MTRDHAYRGAELLPDRAQDWRDQAACLGMDPEVFFPHESGSVAPAKAICAGCDVREQCLKWALVTKQEHGVWGGLSTKERKRYAKATGADITHYCTICDATFQAAPTARPKYCPDCRPAARTRTQRDYQKRRAVAT